MHWLLVGYMFLFIHRPFEVWPWIGELHVERVYMLLTLAVWLVWPGKRFLPNWQHAAYAFFASAVLAAWSMSPFADKGQPVVEDYFKILVFYLLMVTSVNDERGLKRIVVGFMVVMALYLTHSFREYLGGRHTYRMGISRLIGVDTTLGDPNSFGASIVFALPFIVVIWRSGIGGSFGKIVLVGYLGLSILCLLLTGSRSSLLGFIVWSLLLTVSIRRGWLAFLGLAMVAPVAFFALPQSMQTRFETIVNPDVGSEIERQSGEGRIQGFFTGLELFAANPLMGVGPGAWRPATGSSIESHNLFGQLVGELGTLGILGFLAVVLAFLLNLRAMRRLRREMPENEHDFAFHVSKAVGISLFLLFVMGCFGHNLFRFTWIWYGGFLIIARHVTLTRTAELMEQTQSNEPDAIPESWTPHAGHSVTALPGFG